MVKVVFFHITIAFVKGGEPFVTFLIYYDNYLLFAVFHLLVVVQVLQALVLTLQQH